MTEELKMVMDDAAESMQKAINHLEAELIKIRAGKANPNMIDGIFVDYYGSPTALQQVANVTAMDARTISIPVSYTHLDVYKRQALHFRHIFRSAGESTLTKRRHTNGGKFERCR